MIGLFGSVGEGQSELIRCNRHRNHPKNHAKDDDQAQGIKDDLVSGILLAFHKRGPFDLPSGEVLASSKTTAGDKTFLNG